MEQYINNTTKQTKAGNKKQNVLNKLKDIVNGKNFGIHKKEKKTDFLATVNSIGNILWW